MQQRAAHTKKHVLNLLKRKLSNQEYILLAKGLKFIPTPSSKNAKMSILKDYNEFARQLRCRYMFSHEEKNYLHPFVAEQVINLLLRAIHWTIISI